MYRYLLCGIVILLCILEGVHGHAALVTPKPWWWAASRERPCGGANYTSNPRAIWPVGSNQTITWWVIAGDGMGEVHARLNLLGTTDFSFNSTIPIGFKQPKIDKLGYWQMNFIVPNVDCVGPNNTCTMQFWTDSGGGWYSCTTITIVCNGCEGGYPVSRDDCVKANDLAFCDNKDYQQVLVPHGQTANQIDGLTRDTFNLNHQNPNVFRNGNTTNCLSAYKEMLCELYLGACGNSSSNYTKQKCEAALATCGMTANHTNLYNCSIFPNAPTPTKKPTTKPTPKPTVKPATATTTTTTTTSTSTTTAKSTTNSTSTGTSSTTMKTRSVDPNDPNDEYLHIESCAFKLQFVYIWLVLFVCIFVT